MAQYKLYPGKLIVKDDKSVVKLVLPESTILHDDPNSLDLIAEEIVFALNEYNRRADFSEQYRAVELELYGMRQSYQAAERKINQLEKELQDKKSLKHIKFLLSKLRSFCKWQLF